MGAISSLQNAVGTLFDTPLLFAAGALYAVIVLPQSAASYFGVPFVPTLLQFVTFFITPFVIGGIIAMSYQSMKQGNTSFDTFKSKGKDKYVSLLAANILRTVILIGYGVVAGILFIVVAIFVVGISAGAASGAGSGLDAALGGAALIVIALGAVMALIYLVIIFFIQFLQPAIVVDDVGAIEGFKRSIGVAKSNAVSALGFLVINVIVSILLALPILLLTVVPFLMGSGGAPPTTGPATSPAAGTSGFELGLAASLGATLLTFVITVISVPFRLTYATDFYEAHS